MAQRNQVLNVEDRVVYAVFYQITFFVRASRIPVSEREKEMISETFRKHSETRHYLLEDLVIDDRCVQFRLVAQDQRSLAENLSETVRVLKTEATRIINNCLKKLGLRGGGFWENGYIVVTYGEGLTPDQAKKQWGQRKSQ